MPDIALRGASGVRSRGWRGWRETARRFRGAALTILAVVAVAGWLGSRLVPGPEVLLVRPTAPVGSGASHQPAEAVSQAPALARA